MLHRSLPSELGSSAGRRAFARAGRGAVAAAVVALAVPAGASGQSDAATGVVPWLPVQTLAPDADAYGAQLVTAPGGVSGLTWRSSAGQIMATVKVPGGSPASAEVDANLTPVADEQIAVNDAGHAIVVFEETSGTYARVYAAFRAAGATAWSAPQLVGDGATEHAANPDVALDPAGNAVIVWSAGAEQGQVKSRFRAADGALGPVDTITGAAGAQVNGHRPQVAVDGSGRATAAFPSPYLSGERLIMTATRPPGATSDFADAVSAATGTSEQIETLRVQANAAGDTMVWWLEHYSGWPTKIRALHRDALSPSFGAILEVGGAPGYGISGGSQSTAVAMDGSGDAVALWDSSGEGAEGSSYDEAMGQWSADASVVATTPLYGVALAVGDGGTAMAVWPDGNQIKAMKRSADTATTAGTWGASEVVSDGGYSNQLPRIGMDDEGNAALAWRHIAQSGDPYKLKLRLFDNVAPKHVSHAMPTTLPAGKDGTFVAAFADRVSDVEVSWDFGDGSTAVNGQEVVHAFARPGKYTVTVSAVDGAGRTAAAVTGTVEVTDTTAPETRIDSAPTITNHPVIRFSGTDNVDGALSFACTIDGKPIAGCTSPQELPGLGEGEHTFTVAATDAAANTDATPAHVTFTVDRTAPVFTVDAPAADSETTDSTPTLSGKGGRAAGDETSVVWGVWAGEDLGKEPIQHGDALVAADGTWQTTLAALPVGSYTAVVNQYDEAFNYEHRAIRFRVVEPPVAKPADTTPVDTNQDRPPAEAPKVAPATQPTLAAEPSVPRPTLSVREAVGQSLVGAVGVFQRLGLARLLKGAAPVPCTVPASGSCKIELLAPARKARSAAKKKVKQVVVATGTKRVAAAGPSQVKVKVTKAGRKLLKKSRSLKLTVKTSFTPKGGKATTASRKVTVKAKGRRR